MTAIQGLCFETVSGVRILDTIADHLYSTVHELTDEQLTATIASAKRVTIQNCPYQRFDAVKAILPFALEERRDRGCRSVA
jgi:hypothetical protein